ncbi:hypothetical protein [Myxococcus fulvus]|uniref:hypothetical protein n=1 Tax=Myxococcus fulvus TaxID=33 RepID=UPI0020BDE0A7|nr:hypothetical protein [Myxococcus fulvus]
MALIPYSVWALLAPLVLVTLRRVSRDAPLEARTGGWLIALGGGFVLAHSVLLSMALSMLESWSERGLTFAEGLRKLLLERGVLGSFEYLLFLAAWATLGAFRRARERDWGSLGSRHVWRRRGWRRSGRSSTRTSSSTR